MEQILSNPENIALLTFAMNMLTQFFKIKLFPELDARYINAGLSFIVGTAYLAISGVWGDELVKEVMGVAVTLYATSTGLYKLSKKKS